MNVIKQVIDSNIQPFYATDAKSKIVRISFVTFEDYAEEQAIKLQSEFQKAGTQLLFAKEVLVKEVRIGVESELYKEIIN